jgi:hypothetical protein
MLEAIDEKYLLTASCSGPFSPEAVGIEQEGEDGNAGRQMHA